MTIKLDMVVTSHEELPFIESLDSSITWFCQLMYHIKYFISPFTLDQWPPNTRRL